MGIVYFFISVGIFFILVVLLSVSEQWIKSGFQNLNVWLRWVLFLPLSIARSLSISLAVMLNTRIIFHLNEHFALLLNWVVAPIFFFYTIGITIPKGKKVVTLFFALIWALGGLIEILNREDFWVTRILQVISIVVFMIIWFRLPNSYFYGEKTDLLEP